MAAAVFRKAAAQATFLMMFNINNLGFRKNFQAAEMSAAVSRKAAAQITIIIIGGQ